MICCILFLVVFVGMIVASIYGYIAGAPWKLIAPIDGDNRICGYTDGLEDYAKLYIADIDDAAQPSSAATFSVFDYGVCVKSCPETTTEAIECKTTSEVLTCTKGSRYTTTEFLSYCLPNYDSLPSAVQANWESLMKSVSNSSFGEFFADIMISKWVILISVFIAALTTFLYSWFMNYCAQVLSWISVVLIQIMLVGIGYFAWDYRRDQIADDANYEDESMATWLRWITWLSWIMAGIYYIVIACNFQSLRLAVAVISTASSFVADSKRLLLVPLLYFVLAIAASVLFLCGLVCVSSIGDITAGSAALQTKDIIWTTSTEYIFYGMVFGFCWVLAFIMAMNEFVTIVAAITWYYSDKEIPDDDGIPGDSDVSIGMWWSFRYHGGTLAFGSFILAIVWVIRIIFEYISKKMEDASGNNGCTKCLVSCCRCCLACFDRFIRYLNRNAYIYAALSGEGFCTSAINSFILILKNAAKFGFVEGIAGCFMFIAKFFISTATTLVSFFIMRCMVKVSSPYAPLLIIFIFSYIVSSIFIEIFDTGANTILQCYILDREVLCDDEHIPRSLRKFFSDAEIQKAMAADKTSDIREPLNQDGGANVMH
uniref:Choline transporter-like protein n=1 Tax=Favella ehrenbergii TaxID=182087 RepID=A0A7S3I6Z9_9SPIT|mmetsp:Transcript_6886/g.8214  ORF Transcript_6886/g.8214 Transcript_6886/m.8214 type:complete len:598 (+) Transcript_6886:138-1931(+)